MKLVLICFFIFSCFVVTNSQTNQDYIDSLYSTNPLTRWTALSVVNEFKIGEAFPVLNQIIFNEESENLKLDYLESMAILAKGDESKESIVINIASEFINNTEEYFSNYSSNLNNSILDLRVRLTLVLLQLGNTSTINYVFESLESSPISHNISAIHALGFIIKYDSSFSNQCKNFLIEILNQDTNPDNRFAALFYLYDNFRSESLDQYLNVFNNDPEFSNRLIALEYLFELNYPQLDSLLKYHLVNNSERNIRGLVVDSLLCRFGTPSDLKYVIDYQAYETDSRTKRAISYSVNYFIPPEPDNNQTIASIIDTILSNIDECFTYNWLGDEVFNDGLKATLQSTKANLQNSDSIACAINIKSFQNAVDAVYKDSLNSDPRFVTIEGWKFLYYNAQYILDRLPAIPVISPSTYSLLATHSMKLNKYSVIVQSGDIGVNTAGLPPFLEPGYELSVGANATTPVGYNVKANRILLNQNSVINGNIYYNELNNSQGIINGTQTTPLELPLFAELPEFKSSTPGTEDITVSNNGTRVLTPGSYGNVTINKGGTLVLSGGTYHFSEFTAGQQSNVQYQSQCEVRIAGRLDIGKQSNVIAADTLTHSAKDIVFYVGGINGTDGTLTATPKAAVVGTDCKIRANIYVPNGTVQIKANSEVEGSIIGKDVDIDKEVKIKLKSAY